MSSWPFTQSDLTQMEALGISETQVEAQLLIFQKTLFHPHLDRPCILGDGIQQISSEEMKTYIRIQEKAALEGRFLKFVPASGASSRMFQDLLLCYYNSSVIETEEVFKRINEESSEATAFYRFMNNLSHFAFFEELKARMAQEGSGLEDWSGPGQWQQVLEYLLTEEGLNYCSLPKGLIKFHHYHHRNRTSFEEHLVEAVQTIRDQKGICRILFTISPEHQKRFNDLWEEIQPNYEQTFQSRFQVTFSFQRHSTDTLAVDLENKPFRLDDGSLLFRPGGHGALLTNLNDLQGDLIYLKNIDNVQPDHLKETTSYWKKILGGFLVRIQESAHCFIKALLQEGGNPSLIEEVLAFCRKELSIPEPEGFGHLSQQSQKSFLLKKLNRPIRVCGMVKNEGEPGGGPFWIKQTDGSLTLQIIEKSQVDPYSPEQQALWAGATHFNPVDLVCAVRDYQERPFDLSLYTDPEAVFLSEKSQDGKKIKALELPGLWNGGMSDWNTVFIEVPVSTFTPVKTVNDLLRPEHQPINLSDKPANPL
ncbi:MAG: DUF4301 domain-containing protein [Desulfobacca sp.]|nr:DUF4301 domain-containing protein [Desulfobacca sp.]